MHVLLLHGALGSSAQLSPLANALDGSGYDLHLLDFEGHGDRGSSRPFQMETFADNVVEHMDAHGIETAGIFGYSMGGYVALHLAGREPERVRAVATLGTKFRWDPPTAAREASRLNPAAIRAKVPQFAAALAARHERAGGWETVLMRTADLLRALGDSPLLTDESLRRIGQSVCVIVGDNDNTVSVDESSGAALAMPRGALVVLENTPHPIEHVDAARVGAVLREHFG